VANGKQGGLGTVAQAGLGQDSRDVVLDRSVGERQPLGDFMIGGTGTQEAQDI
jgi:hypothetical protein